MQTHGFRMHPYAVAIAAVLLLSAFTGIHLEERAGSPVAADRASFSTGETQPEGTVYVPYGTSAPIAGAAQQGVSTVFFSPPQPVSQQPSAAPAMATSTAALERLRDYLAALSPAPSATGTAPLDLSSVYQYVPGTHSAGTSESAVAAALGGGTGDGALRSYGNAAGAYVSAFESVSSSQQDALQAFFDTPSDATAAAVTADADAMDALAQELARMSDVPPAVQTVHENLAAAYRVAAGKLRAVGNARSDSDLSAAVTSYDESAQALGSAFVAMVSFFSSHDVVFADGEAGHVFTYTASL
ncbi:MAG TPA: hypothetical protein VFL98_02715 [Candidatus Paceibacterota bacterium]|nr:hypothetical protein [Candidatus Paceibacterota bacterium]